MPKECICGTSAGDMDAHIDSHITKITMPGGWPGRSYDCPVCGPSDEAWGNPDEADMSLTNMSRHLFKRHCKQVHGINL